MGVKSLKPKTKNLLGNQNGTFIIDALFLLPWVFGPLMVFLATRWLFNWIKNRKIVVAGLFATTMLGFWLMAGWGLYFDGVSLEGISRLTGTTSGNDFMWNWPFNLFGLQVVGQNQIPTYADFYGWLNILAMFFFIVVYPLMLWLGIQAGYLLFGRSEKQKGVVCLFFKRSTSKNEFN